MVRDCIARALEASSIAGQVRAASGEEEALGLLAAGPCELLVTELSLAEGSGIGLIKEARKRFPSVPILVLTRLEDERLAIESLASGVDGYLLKSASFDELRRAVAQVSAGGSFLPRVLSSAVLTELRRPRGNDKIYDGTTFTDREREILGLLFRGASNQQIATALHVSLSTVKSHLRTAYTKLSASDRTQAVLRALEMGVLPSRQDRPGGR